MIDEPEELDDVINYPITDELDLHTFQPSETRSVVEEYLKECVRLGIKKVRIIHGKGMSVQKNIVYSVLQDNPLVAEFHDAPPEYGGWGATVVELSY